MGNSAASVVGMGQAPMSIEDSVAAMVMVVSKIFTFTSQSLLSYFWFSDRWRYEGRHLRSLHGP